MWNRIFGINENGQALWSKYLEKNLNHVGTRLRQLYISVVVVKKKKAKGRHLNLVTQV